MKLQEEEHQRKKQELKMKFKNTTKSFEIRINELEDEKQKFIKEIMQVKMILKSPFLYEKYRNAKFEYFEHLSICKFDPKEEQDSTNKVNLLTDLR